MKKYLLTWTIALLCILVSAALATARRVEVQAEAPGQSDVETVAGPAEVNGQYQAYGFVFEQYDDHDQYGRFTDHELNVLGSVIVAYAEWVGERRHSPRWSVARSACVGTSTELCPIPKRAR